MAVVSRGKKYRGAEFTLFLLILSSLHGTYSQIKKTTKTESTTAKSAVSPSKDSDTKRGYDSRTALSSSFTICVSVLVTKDHSSTFHLIRRGWKSMVYCWNQTTGSIFRKEILLQIISPIWKHRHYGCVSQSMDSKLSFLEHTDWVSPMGGKRGAC